MALYVFSLLVGYEPNGVDYAQGNRARYLKKLSKPVKYVYTDVIKEPFVRHYRNTGIATEDMISAHLFMCGNGNLGKDVCITEKDFYSNGHLVVREYYSDRLLFTEEYGLVTEGDRLVNKVIRRSFRNSDATSAFDMIFDSDNKERYVYPNGENISKQEFIGRFIQQLNLTKNDVILIDRPCQLAFVQPLFMYVKETPIVTFLHSEHYAELGEANHFLYLNYEYYYWFKNSDYIHTMLVSSEEQKRELIKKLKEYDCCMPAVEVIPASGLKQVCYPKGERKPCSLLTVSRLVPEKRIDWIIRSVIEAHYMNDKVSLDIYGSGAQQNVLMKLVEEHQAQSYIRFMGHRDVSNVYAEYEAYISASKLETLGLSLMEAVGSGNAMLGVNTRYGSQIFIRDDVNGFLIEYDSKRSEEECYVDRTIHRMAQGIIKLFENAERLEKFHEESYRIAGDYLDTVIEEKWLSFLEGICAENQEKSTG